MGVCDRVTYCVDISVLRMSKSALWNQSNHEAWIF